MRKFTAFVRFPCPDNVEPAVYLGVFLASVTLVLGEILIVCDDSEKQSVDGPPLVVRWNAPLQQCFRKELPPPQVMASPLPRLIDEFCVQVPQELAVDESGLLAFKTRLRLLTNHFDNGDQGRTFEQLNTFGVPNLTDFLSMPGRPKNACPSHKGQSGFSSRATPWSSRLCAASRAANTRYFCLGFTLGAS